MPTTPHASRVAVLGAGPAGMAAALSLHQAGIEVSLIERYKEARPAGNILNLWPPPIKALGLMGVDVNRLRSPLPVRVPQRQGQSPRRGPPAPGRRRQLRRRLHRLAAARALRAAARRPAAGDAAGQPRGLLLRPGRDRGDPPLRRRHDREVRRRWSAPTASTPWSAARCGAMSPSASTTCTSSAASRSTTPWRSSRAAASSPTTGPPRAAGPRSATRGAAASSGGC